MVAAIGDLLHAVEWAAGHHSVVDLVLDVTGLQQGPNNEAAMGPAPQVDLAEFLLLRLQVGIGF